MSFNVVQDWSFSTSESKNQEYLSSEKRNLPILLINESSNRKLKETMSKTRTTTKNIQKLKKTITNKIRKLLETSKREEKKLTFSKKRSKVSLRKQEQQLKQTPSQIQLVKFKLRTSEQFGSNERDECLSERTASILTPILKSNLKKENFMLFNNDLCTTNSQSCINCKSFDYPSYFKLTSTLLKWQSLRNDKKDSEVLYDSNDFIPSSYFDTATNPSSLFQQPSFFNNSQTSTPLSVKRALFNKYVEQEETIELMEQSTQAQLEPPSLHESTFEHSSCSHISDDLIIFKTCP